MSKMVTRLYVYGKNGLSIENFPTDKYHTFGKKYIECYDYFTKNKDYFNQDSNSDVPIEYIEHMGYVIEGIFKDDRCEDFSELYSNAIQYLLDHCKPKEEDIDVIKYSWDKGIPIQSAYEFKELENKILRLEKKVEMMQSKSEINREKMQDIAEYTIKEIERSSIIRSR